MAGAPKRVTSAYGNSAADLPNPSPSADAIQAAPSVPQMPAPNPQPTPLPTPAGAPAQSADSLLSGFDSADQLLAQFEATPTAPASDEERPWYSVSAEGLTRGALNTLPVVGGVVGGIMAAPTAPATFGLGPVAAAGLGGMAGASLKNTLEKAIFGVTEGPQTREELYKNIAVEGATQAAGEGAGQVLASAAKMSVAGAKKIGEKIAEIPLSMPEKVREVVQKFGGDVSAAADSLRTKISEAISATRGELEKPALEVVAKKATTLSDVETGTVVKQLIKDNVNTRYKPFTDSYKTLREVNATIPIGDESRKRLGDNLTNWALEEFPQNSQFYRLVQKHKVALQASNNGAQFENAIKAISDDMTAAYKSGNTNRGKMLGELKDRATQFADNQVEKLATKIQKGTATPQEVGFVQKVMETRGITGEDPTKYAKILANDFLKGKAQINADYGGFKNFMRSVGEQTKVKGANEGTVSFLHKLDAVPAEKLVSKMMDPKNAASLAAMKQEMPEVFDQLAGFHVKEIAKKSSTDGALNMTKFHDEVMSLPKEVRNLMFSPDDLRMLATTAKNPKLTRLNELTSSMNKSLITPGTEHTALANAGTKVRTDNRGLRDLGELSNLTGMNIVQPTQTFGQMSQYMNSRFVTPKGYEKAVIDSAAKAVPKSPAARQAVKAISGRAAVKAVKTVKDAAGSDYGQ